MTKLRVKRYSLLHGKRVVFSHNDALRVYEESPEPLYLGNYSIRDNHAVIEKLAEKAKNN